MLAFDKETDGIRVAVWKAEEDFTTLMHAIPEGEAIADEAQCMFKSEKRRKEWLTARVLLRTILGRPITIRYKTSGAPFFADIPLHLSISHTKGYVAAALSPSNIVGVDVEQVSPNICKLKSRICGSSESADSALKITLHWSAKETAFKIIDNEGIDFIENLKIEPFEINDKGSGTFNLYETATQRRNVYKIHYSLLDDTVLTFAKNPDMPNGPTELR